MSKRDIIFIFKLKRLFREIKDKLPKMNYLPEIDLKVGLIENKKFAAGTLLQYSQVYSGNLGTSFVTVHISHNG